MVTWNATQVFFWNTLDQNVSRLSIHFWKFVSFSTFGLHPWTSPLRCQSHLWTYQCTFQIAINKTVQQEVIIWYSSNYSQFSKFSNKLLRSWNTNPLSRTNISPTYAINHSRECHKIIIRQPNRRVSETWRTSSVDFWETALPRAR